MDYVDPVSVTRAMIEAAATKIKLPATQLLLRGSISGALLAFATSLAFVSNAQGLPPLVGAIIFPVGFAMIVVLGLELVTGSFALIPLMVFEGETSVAGAAINLSWVFCGNLLGALFYALLLSAIQTQFYRQAPTGAAALMVAAAEAKTIGYAKLGASGLAIAFIKGILCNWMVCMGVVMGMTSRSTLGKIVASWLPVLTFFAQGFEHSVVNMFLIPAGMMMGAKVSLRQWWFWNQIPVTLGNVFGGAVFVGLAMYIAFVRKAAPRMAVREDPVATSLPMEAA
jgi:formate/nitrite transporter